jgi:uncharacterized protein YgbK (DUF1537 family)
MSKKCLIIADDLTGGADAGAQFAKRGLNTLLISIKGNPTIDLSQYNEGDVLVVNTDSRGLSSEKAFSLTSSLLKGYDRELFPIIYKKIDSTLRGNIGYEIDAVLKETNISLCFMAPSYPEQRRTLIGGIMMVGERPVALTEAAHDTASPVHKSHVYKLLGHQSSHKIGRIDLTDVASGTERLKKAVGEEQKKGNRIIIFDAFSRQDLIHIADVAFCLDQIPLFVGSAGLAEEVAKKISPSKARKISQPLQRRVKPFKHIFIISGSISGVTHEQLKRVEQNKKIAPFQLSKSLLMSENKRKQAQKNNLSSMVSNSLTQGHAMLKAYLKRLSSKDLIDAPIYLEITKTLASLALSALEKSKIDAHDLALILTGGDTALSVLNALNAKEIEIEGELLEGIVKGHLIGGDWDGLTIITKAGAFGKEYALKRIIEILETGSSSSKQKACF